jgi:hypothetical protein
VKVDARGISPGVVPLPSNARNVMTRLSRRTTASLLRKHEWLKTHTVEDAGKTVTGDEQTNSIQATLIFAQEEAGTAVCVSASGVLLTCAHCIAENPWDVDESMSRWLLFRSGRIVEAKVLVWDPTRDLALLQIIKAQELDDKVNESFPHVTIAERKPTPNASLYCVGQPGPEDLETDKAGVKTGYDILHVSIGKFRGYAKDQDPQDNSDIGCLKHDCWTYWGHSGAPLLESKTGELVGLHSSWDEDTGMRRGVPLEAIRSFLKENPGFMPTTRSTGT